jgi:hypothetical protein
MTADEKAAYATSRFLETGAWRAFTEQQQKEFWKLVKEQRVPQPLPKPRDLGKDSRGRDIGSYTPEEYRAYRKREEQLARFRRESERFASEKRSQAELGEESPGATAERNRRKVIAGLRGKAMGRYEGNPQWDDVVPIPQEEGEGALAQIAYTDEYAEGTLLHCYVRVRGLTPSHSNGIPPRHHGRQGTLPSSVQPYRAHHISQRSALHSMALPRLDHPGPRHPHRPRD